MTVPKMRVLPVLVSLLLAGLAGCRAPSGNAPPAGQGAVPPPYGANNPAASANGGTTEGVRDVQVTADEYRFDPNEITVQPGQAVRVTLTNRGDMPHNIEFELPSGEVELDENLDPGATGTLQFTAPEAAGRYVFYCPVGDHREQGMTGTLIVEPSAVGA